MQSHLQLYIYSMQQTTVTKANLPVARPLELKITCSEAIAVVILLVTTTITDVILRLAHFSTFMSVFSFHKFSQILS